MDNYIVLDIETPNGRSNSICAISVLLIRDTKLVEEYYSLINPEDRFDIKNSTINGITANMILDKPTFKEYWNIVKNLLTNNIIIGHNITFDLSVISNALQRYDIEVPKFKYIDTLKLSQNYLNLDSYKLTSIMNHLNYEYKEHDALEDTKATYTLFEYLCKNFDNINLNPLSYEFHAKLKDNIDSKLSKNINELYGIIQGINYDGIVNEKEVQRLNKWINDNELYIQYRLFYNIINSLNKILKDNIIDKYERLELLNLVQSINHSKIYNETTLSLQILYGIVDGIICDDKIVEDEVWELNKWLETNNYLTGTYPYDKIVSIVKNIVKDYVISESEKAELLTNLKNTLNPSEKNMGQIELQGKTFCLTGEFKCGSKSEVKVKFENLGAMSKNSVSSKIDYLFVGGLGSEAWKFGNVGGKIAKAQELQERGCKIQIIPEDEALKMIV